MKNELEATRDRLDALETEYFKGRKLAVAVVTEVLRHARNLLRALATRAEYSGPVNMIIFCPACGAQHIDAPNLATGWTNPPHRSHLCHDCGNVWRHCDVLTNGVKSIISKGEKDAVPIVLPRRAGTMDPDSIVLLNEELNREGRFECARDMIRVVQKKWPGITVVEKLNG